MSPWSIARKSGEAWRGKRREWSCTLGFTPRWRETPQQQQHTHPDTSSTRVSGEECLHVKYHFEAKHSVTAHHTHIVPKHTDYVMSTPSQSSIPLYHRDLQTMPPDSLPRLSVTPLSFPTSLCQIKNEITPCAWMQIWKQITFFLAHNELKGGLGWVGKVQATSYLWVKF